MGFPSMESRFGEEGQGPVLFGQQPPRMVALGLLDLCSPDAAAQNWVRTWAQLRLSQHADQERKSRGRKKERQVYGGHGSTRHVETATCGLITSGA